ncbi:MAG: hypothetical protein C5B54_01410 [Acidobacteria bacterium]|nr:MAG: hypothetical protein C5B54_01410 [Acidobacteriota bacterium]
MDCEHIPAPTEWDEAEDRLLQEYRRHISQCRECHARVLREAPDQLLFELNSEPLPEEFWIGFWPSIRSRLGSIPTPQISFRFVRWAAVFVITLLLVIFGRSGSQTRPPVTHDLHPYKVNQPDTGEYPLVEVQNPKAKYYIFQPGGNEKVVMVFDPDMEL